MIYNGDTMRHMSYKHRSVTLWGFRVKVTNPV